MKEEIYCQTPLNYINKKCSVIFAFNCPTPTHPYRKKSEQKLLKIACY